MLAVENLVGESGVAIVIAQIKANIGVQVLNHKLDTHVSRARTHGLELAGVVVAGEHAAVVVAGIVGKSACFLPVGEVLAGAVAGGGGGGDAEGEDTGDGGEDGGGLHGGESEVVGGSGIMKVVDEMMSRERRAGAALLYLTPRARRLDACRVARDTSTFACVGRWTRIRRDGMNSLTGIDR